MKRMWTCARFDMNSDAVMAMFAEGRREDFADLLQQIVTEVGEGYQPTRIDWGHIGGDKYQVAITVQRGDSDPLEVAKFITKHWQLRPNSAGYYPA